MKNVSKKILGVIIGVIVIASIAILLQSKLTSLTIDDNKSSIHSPYTGQELTRGIKALSQDDVEGLLAGSGTPFGGMAKPAELNGYPGPKHVLDAYEAGELDLKDEQYERVKVIYEEMRTEAIKLGEHIIKIEEEIDEAFTNKTITEKILEEKVKESAELYGQLRIVHLKHHLSLIEVLSPQQVAEYNELRGYNSEDPCENIPEGHDPEMWKLHNDCE